MAPFSTRASMLGMSLFRRSSIARLFLAGALLGLWQAPAIGAGTPDARLAYRLATASYCAYAVNEMDEDRGQARALACLRAAATADPGSLGSLAVTAGDIEAWFDAARPEDGYLLIKTRKGVIIAFRGTTPPPVSREGEADREALAERRGRDPWGTFITDFFKNFDAGVNERGRHSGFDEAWRGLWAHLQKTCAAGRNRADCSKFNAFLRARGENGARLFLTGHSKGGALAALAGLDIPAATGTTPVVYAFAAPKAVSEELARAQASAAATWWRFERADDLVPALPPDGSVPIARLSFGSAYAKLGNLLYFSDTAAPVAVTAEAEAALLPPDMSRLPMFLLNQGGAVLLSWFSADLPEKILNSNETACRVLLDRHFMIFSDVRALAANRQPKAARLRRQAGVDFFATGLESKGEQILWGYREWCGHLQIVDRPAAAPAR